MDALMREFDEFVLLSIWPQAKRIDFSGECPICRTNNEYSFVLPQFDTLSEGNMQSCGYWCSACGWSNAGQRVGTSDDMIAALERGEV